MIIATIVLFILTLFFGFFTIVSPKKQTSYGEAISPMGYTFGATAVFLLLTALIAGWLAIAPEYRLYRANIEKRIIVTEAKAQADADHEHARGEVERARGTAQANKIVAGSITEPYLRYLYVNNLAKLGKGQVIYVPTEAGMPILEAGRGVSVK